MFLYWINRFALGKWQLTVSHSVLQLITLSLVILLIIHLID